jgi:hypothetical protein
LIADRNALAAYVTRELGDEVSRRLSFLPWVNFELVPPVSHQGRFEDRHDHRRVAISWEEQQVKSFAEMSL